MSIGKIVKNDESWNELDNECKCMMRLNQMQKKGIENDVLKMFAL